MIVNFNKRRFNKKYIEKIIEAYEYALKLLKIPCKDVEVNIDFVSAHRIKSLNNNFRQKNTETDVLSFPNLLEVGKVDMQLIIDKITKKNFPNEVNPENNCIFLGDICICKKVAYAHAKEYGNSKAREMVYMAVHGLLHLLGYDHMLDEDKKIMRETEEKIMKKIKLERD
ncbi:MAG: rRNA maturation RNase YbeY [Clostridia bacterium]|nr:rRNA maturation RNase YbeY [Clostridia bacterium]